MVEGLHLPYCSSSSVEDFWAIFKSLAWDFVEGLSEYIFLVHLLHMFFFLKKKNLLIMYLGIAD